MNRKTSEMDEKAQALLQRAYSLKDSSQSQALYASWAKTYDKTMLEGLGYLTPKNTAALLSKFVAAKQLRTLDVGSGTGLAGLELNALGFTHLDALDYSPQMLAVAAHRGVYKNIIEADLNQMLDIPDDTYDAMICTGTFTHAHVSAKCLDELFRILKPAGHFACTVHNDIWHTEGFEEKTTALSKTGLLKTVNQELGIYYADSTTPEGWYIVWQKQG